MMTAIRLGGPGDLEAVEAIQYCCPEAVRWRPADYLHQDFRVATIDGSVAGFVVTRRVAPDECEVLNLAVSPDYRRRGLAGKLLAAALAGFRGYVFLEVRESNSTGLKFYKSLGFQEVSRRSAYYEDPPETAIVLKFHSC